jgi:outer membrane lipoprotein SlyB
LIARFSLCTALFATLAGCGPNYSPNTYATDAVQQANKVDAGVIVGVRQVDISASGTTGAVVGGAAGGIAGAQVGSGAQAAFTTLGSTLVGGIAGSATEHVISDTSAFEYIIRQPNGDMLSVTQKDKVPLMVGQKVLVIAGKQARVVPDYTVPVEVGEKAKPAAPVKQEANATAPPPAPVTATPLAPPAPAPTVPLPAITEAPPPNAETGP